MNNSVTKDNLMRTLPAALYCDDNMRALAEPVASELESLFRQSEKTIIYGRIDDLDESVLDALARDFKVDWWRPDANIEEKRETIKANWYVHRHLGTKSAVETAVKSFLGDASVEEWFDYGGLPYHFRIMGAANASLNEHFDEFLSILGIVQRGSAVLDSIISRIQSSMNIRVAIAMRSQSSMTIECNDVDESIIEIFADRNVSILTDEVGNILIDEKSNVLYE